MPEENRVENGEGLPDASEHDLEALRATQVEVRTVLNHQIRTFNDMDDKAARTFRLDAILLGLALTAASFLTRSNAFGVEPYVNTGTKVGIILLIVSFVVAVSAYTTTTIQTGLAPRDVRRLIGEKYTEQEWLVLLLLSEATWIRKNDRQLTINGMLLTVSHLSLILSVFSFSVGVLTVYWL